MRFSCGLIAVCMQTATSVFFVRGLSLYFFWSTKIQIYFWNSCVFLIVQGQSIFFIHQNLHWNLFYFMGQGRLMILYSIWLPINLSLSLFKFTREFFVLCQRQSKFTGFDHIAFRRGNRVWLTNPALWVSKQ